MGVEKWFWKQWHAANSICSVGRQGTYGNRQREKYSAKIISATNEPEPGRKNWSPEPKRYILMNNKRQNYL